MVHVYSIWVKCSVREFLVAKYIMILTHDGSSILVRSSAQNGLSNASEFCSLSEPDSADHR